MSNKFKNDMGNHYTHGLFYETAPDKSTVIYTLKEEDHTVGDIVYPSLRRIYIEMEDPTEYRVATEALGGWNHWKKLTEASWFRPYIDNWREELNIRLKSKALSKIMETADKPSDRNYHIANKLLLESGWKEKPQKGGVGRTTKDKIKEEAEKLFRSDSDIDDDHKRIMVN